MNLAFLLFIFISYSNCYTIKKVPFKVNTSLSTNTTKANYFYLESKEFSFYEKIYLDFKDNSYYLDYNSLQICYTDNNPTISLQSCFFTTKTPFYKSISSSYREFCYEINTKISNNVLNAFIVVFYSGSYSFGSLYVKASETNIYKTVKTIFETIFSSIALMLLFFVGIVFLIILIIVIIVIIICCLCARKKTTVGTVRYIQPQATYIIANTATIPLTTGSY